jgi:hypothetical protein
VPAVGAAVVLVLEGLRGRATFGTSAAWPVAQQSSPEPRCSPRGENGYFGSADVPADANRAAVWFQAVAVLAAVVFAALARTPPRSSS